ncbi:unnamed protein product [Adineta steineri]|uniref:Uncharacterized protein n=1 Tax=Adineta steineri TaxID=433720 RepID=A0A815NMN0_9BILA|nr:unnamed protein product [Adineta steineri]CAF3495090.1 unnamed protein product [Adineta steineri]
MSSKFFISAIFFFEFISIWCGCNGGHLDDGDTFNVTGQIPCATFSRTTSLYATDINMTLTVCQGILNNWQLGVSLVINGSTNVDSTNRCIARGVSIAMIEQYPIINNQETGNGGCDAILGSECSKSIRKSLQQSFNDINSTGCGVQNLDIFADPLTGCRFPDRYISTFMIYTLRKNGSSESHNSSTANSEKSMDSTDFLAATRGNHGPLKPFVFTYFMGRPYSSGIIDTAIACFPIYNVTVAPKTTALPNDIATQLFVSRKFLIFLLLLHFFSRFMVYLP